MSSPRLMQPFGNEIGINAHLVETEILNPTSTNIPTPIAVNYANANKFSMTQGGGFFSQRKRNTAFFQDDSTFEQVENKELSVDDEPDSRRLGLTGFMSAALKNRQQSKILMLDNGGINQVGSQTTRVRSKKAAAVS